MSRLNVTSAAAHITR